MCFHFESAFRINFCPSSMAMGRVTLNMLGCRGQSGRRPSESSELRSAGKRGRKNFRHLCLHRRTNPNPLHRTPQRNSVHDNTVPDTSPGWSSHLKWARMSVATGSKGEKAKKFQSLNINNLYQVSFVLRCPEVVLWAHRPFVHFRDPP